MLAQIDFESGLQDAWHNVATIVPKLLAFFLILLIGWFIAKALSKLTNRLLERVGFDGWVERGSLREAFERNHTDASDLVAVLVFWIVFLVTLQLAFGIWGPNPISDAAHGVDRLHPADRGGCGHPRDRGRDREGPHRCVAAHARRGRRGRLDRSCGRRRGTRDRRLRGVGRAPDRAGDRGGAVLRLARRDRRVR